MTVKVVGFHVPKFHVPQLPKGRKAGGRAPGCGLLR